MSLDFHTYCRAMLAGMAFCMSLIMTPRVWVEAPADATQDPTVPVNQLEQGQDCLWCNGETPSADDCSEYDRFFLFDGSLFEDDTDDCDEHRSGPHA